jgi:hypothetical protein
MLSDNKIAASILMAACLDGLNKQLVSKRGFMS